MANITKQNNFISNSDFTFTCNYLDKLTYDGDTYILPNISLATLELHGSNVDIQYPGEKLNYSPLTIVFKVDENFSNYISIHDWMNKIVTVNNPSAMTSDAIVTIKNKVGKPIAEAQLTNIFPITLSPVTFSYVDQTSVIEAEVEFETEQMFFRKL